MAFRGTVYAALGPRRDALCDLVDALLVSGRVPSLAHLSLTAPHRRGYGSLYAALARGQLDPTAVEQVVAACPLMPVGRADDPPEQPALYAVDVSGWPRPSAETSAARVFCHQPRAGRGRARAPVVPGWDYQWVAQVGWERTSWTAPLGVARVPPTQTANRQAVAQILALRQRLPPAPAAGRWWLFDAGYDSLQLVRGIEAGLGAALEAHGEAVLVRVRANRCFYAEPGPLPPGTPGRPPRHGARFACHDPSTWPVPSATHQEEDARYGTVVVQAWAGLHAIPRDHPNRGRSDARHLVPVVPGTLVRLTVSRLPGHTHAPVPLWLWGTGAGLGAGCLDLAQVWRAYVRRFDLEHTFRFLKQELCWTLPHLRTPEQADRWTALVLLAYTLLRLARPFVDERRLPWERALPAEHARHLTPGRVRRGFAALLGRLGTPAAAAQPCGRSPGRPKGRRSLPATRYPVVKKIAPSSA